MDRQERAEDAQIGQTGFECHAHQSRRGGSADKAQQDGLGLVVGVVGQEDAEQVVAGDDLSEKLLSGDAVTGRGVGGRVVERGFDLVETGEGAGDGKAICQVRDERGVVGAGAGAGLVVEMDDVDRDVRAGGAEQSEQCDRIRAAADRDGPGAGRDEGDGLTESVDS